MSMLLSPPVCFLTAASWADDELRQWGMMVALVAFSAMWITALGASVGSFLNVVVWRLPNGMSLIRPKSHCPKCGTPILPRDNLPVIGWLQLRGRCRACREPISARYPLVEATTAMLFLGLAHFELFGGGANLPGGPPMPEGLTAVLWHVRPQMIGVFVYHATLASLLLSMSLIVWDGLRPPRSLWGVGLAIALLVPVVLPMAHPVKSGLPIGSLPQWHLAVDRVVVPVVSEELLNGAIGSAVGALVGAILSLAVPPGTRSAADRTGTIAVGSLVGAFMGWQAVVACGLLTAVLALLNAVVARLTLRHLPVTGIFSVFGVAYLLLWRPLTTLEALPGPTGWSVLHRLGWPAAHFVSSSFAAAVAVAALFAVLAWLFCGKRSIRASNHLETAGDTACSSHS
jgi:prepilin signal peptidase PulO-like enzyme (type II secretory pathway)